MTDSRFNVLISSAGRRVALIESFRHALKTLAVDGHVLAADASRASAAFHSADGAFVVPRCTSSEFIEAILDLCRMREIRLVVPTIDTELPVYAAARERLSAAGVTVAISAADVIAIANDKRGTHRWLRSGGFPTVRQAEVADVLAAPSDWPFPLLVKPATGSSSIGVRQVADSVELRVATRGGNFIVQSLAPGIEHTVDVYVDRGGRCRCAVPRRRIEVRAGEVSKAVTVRSEPLIGLARRLFEALPGAWAVHNVQIFVHGDDLSIIEINPRFGGGFPLSWQAGAHFPQWLIEETLGRDSSANEAWKAGQVMLRWDAAVFVDEEAIDDTACAALPRP